MVRTREIQSTYHWDVLLRMLRDVFGDWEVAREDWTVTALKPGPGVELTYYLPYDPEPHQVVALGQRYYERNLHAIYHHVSAMQRDSLRGVTATYGGQQFLALPPGSAEEAEKRWHQPPPKPRRQSLPSVSPFKGLADACDFLGVSPKAGQAVVNAAYRALMREANGRGDAGAESMKKLNAARDFVFERMGWTVEQEALG